MSKPAKVIILLLNWNGKADTLECLASLQKLTYPHFQVLIVDNGSNDDSVAVIRAKHPDIPILETNENLGFAGGNNVGIEWALRHLAEWILLLNNDTIVAPDLIEAFLSAAQEHPKAKILGAKILRYDHPKTIEHLGGFWNPHIAEFHCPEAGQTDHPYFNMQKADYVCGAALFMHRSVPETIGLLEPNFFLLWEETDFCCRSRKAGLEVWTAPDARVWHKGSSSFVGGKPHMYYFWWRSRLLWIERNCSVQERKQIYSKVIIPEIWKLSRHCLLKFLFSSDRAKLQRYKAGCAGVIDYFRGRFGNCPKWILKNQTRPKKKQLLNSFTHK